MTGQFQSQGITTPTQFSNQILCPNMPLFMPCSPSNPVVSMAVINDFTTLVHQTTHQLPGQGAPTITQYTLNPLPSAICSPQQGSLVYIQAEYTMPLGLMAVYAIFGGTLTSGATVKVEEFPTGNATFTNCNGQSGTPCCPA
jgi:hypothetical protein